MDLEPGMNVEVINIKNIKGYNFFVDESKVTVGAVGIIKNITNVERGPTGWPEIHIEFKLGDLTITHNLYPENIKLTKKRQTFSLLFPKAKKISGKPSPVPYSEVFTNDDFLKPNEIK